MFLKSITIRIFSLKERDYLYFLCIKKNLAFGQGSSGDYYGKSATIIIIGGKSSSVDSLTKSFKAKFR